MKNGNNEFFTGCILMRLQYETYPVYSTRDGRFIPSGESAAFSSLLQRADDSVGGTRGTKFSQHIC